MSISLLSDAAREVLNKAEKIGLTLTCCDGQIIMKGKKSQLTQQFKDSVKEHKPELLRRISMRQNAQQQLDDPGYFVMHSDVIGEKIIVARDSKVKLPPHLQGLIKYTMVEMESLRNAPDYTIRYVHLLKVAIKSGGCEFDS